MKPAGVIRKLAEMAGVPAYVALYTRSAMAIPRPLELARYRELPHQALVAFA